MRKSRPSLKGLAEFAEAVIGGYGPIFGVNMDGSAGDATQNRKEKRVSKYKGLNPMSENYIHKLNDEVFERVELCKRCGGQPFLKTRPIHLNNGKEILLTSVICVGGMCEICREPARGETLRPHEYKVSRGQGGKVSIGNSVMCHWRCHQPQHTTSKSKLKPIIPPKRLDK